MRKIVSLWLEGPLQSWGAESRFGYRTTLPFPSRSGLSGLLGAALGLEGEQREWLAKLNACPLEILRFSRKMPAPILTDYQTVGFVYDGKDSWENYLIPKKNNGKPAQSVSGAKITYRQYLQDEAFACFLNAPEDLASEIQNGLEFPRWPLCLGRKNCIPTEFIFQGIFDEIEEAKEAAEKMALEKKRKLYCKITEGEEGLFDEMWTVHDVPLAFGFAHENASRKVMISYAD